LSNIGPDGSQTVIKKIPVSAEFNSFIFDQTVIANDYNLCSGQTLKKLHFQSIEKYIFWKVKNMNFVLLTEKHLGS
jgi:hypothetical protein